jgi:hypothetical protein
MGGKKACKKEGMDGLEGNKIKGLGEEGNPRGKKEDWRIEEREEWMLGGRGLTRMGIGQEGLRKKRVEEWRDGGMERGERRNKRNLIFFIFRPTIFKPTSQGKPARPGIGGFGLEI